MRIGIKKKYVVGLFAFLSASMGFVLVKEAYWWIISQNDWSILIVPTVFVIATIYVLLYFMEYHFKTKIVDETAKEVAGGDIGKENKIKEHLLNKIWNESYLFRIKL